MGQNWKFQGQEHQTDFGLNWYAFKWRNHQPDIGRFFNVDPLAEDYYYNSPYAFSENKVVAHVELEGLESKRFDWKNQKVIHGSDQIRANTENYPDYVQEVSSKPSEFKDFKAKDGEMVVIGNKSEEIATEDPAVKSDKVSGIIDGEEMLNGPSGKDPSNVFHQVKNLKKLGDNLKSLTGDDKTTATMTDDDGNFVILRDNYETVDLDGSGTDGKITITEDSIVKQSSTKFTITTVVKKEDTSYTKTETWP